ncbi:MAG: DNA-binding response regulator [Saprospirales bacterium]|nr:DNA-binding response regulator [Saprospirales bacterium]MBK6902159.1 DNA-binding response regulator [Saprospirales bacterium]MBK7337329.1 DNA-binding response regulator [Saprospirales bacterium]
MTQSLFRILIVEDDPIIAEDIAMTLEDLGFYVVGKAHHAARALELLDELLPDLVLLDIDLGGGQNGIQLGGTINREYRIPFIYLTALSDILTLQRVKATLPAGFVLKPFDENRLRAAIEIARHSYYAVIRSHFGHLEDINRSLPEALTSRELDLLQLLCRGKANQELADELFVSINTVKTHLKNLFLKLGVESRAEAIIKVQHFLQKN